jgi:hypothetical protein
MSTVNNAALLSFRQLCVAEVLFQDRTFGNEKRVILALSSFRRKPNVRTVLNREKRHNVMRYFTRWFVLLHGVGGAVMLEAEVAAQTHRAPEGN